MSKIFILICMPFLFISNFADLKQLNDDSTKSTVYFNENQIVKVVGDEPFKNELINYYDTVIYESSNEFVAKVNEDGFVNVLNAGTTTIEAIIGTDIKYSYELVVEQQNIIIKPKDVTIKEGETIPNNFEYTMTSTNTSQNIINIFQRAPKFSVNTDGKKAGAYEITIEEDGILYGTNSKNINITYETGLLTVVDEELTDSTTTDPNTIPEITPEIITPIETPNVTTPDETIMPNNTPTPTKDTEISTTLYIKPSIENGNINSEEINNEISDDIKYVVLNLKKNTSSLINVDINLVNSLNNKSIENLTLELKDNINNEMIINMDLKDENYTDLKVEFINSNYENTSSIFKLEQSNEASLKINYQLNQDNSSDQYYLYKVENDELIEISTLKPDVNNFVNFEIKNNGAYLVSSKDILVDIVAIDSDEANIDQIMLLLGATIILLYIGLYNRKQSRKKQNEEKNNK